MSGQGKNAGTHQRAELEVPATTDTDVLVVGSGIMGAGVARLVRDARKDARILMIDGGPVIGSLPGQHLHDTPEVEIWRRYNEKISSGVQALYTGPEMANVTGGTLVGVDPGMYSLTGFGEDAAEMRAGAVAWNVGGMGAHWTAACPWPAGAEVPDFLPAAEWDADLETARELLHVHPDPFGGSPAGDIVLAALDVVFGSVSEVGRHVQTMPMAITPTTGGGMRRTGPNRIFEPMAYGGDDAFELRADTLATRLDHAGGRVSGVTVRNTLTDEVTSVTAKVVIVCCDAMRTPQLLWASGIRPPALGRHLNEHAFITGQVLADLDRLGIDEVPSLKPGEWASGSYWLPQNGKQQPFHAQIMDKPLVDPATGEQVGYSVGVSFYVPTEVRAENRLEFSDVDTDAAGLPRITVHYSYSDSDLQLIEQARASQASACNSLGDFVPERDSLLLPAGSSLHYSGTVRMGPADDGTSVCDSDARVWGFDNLHVAGNGVIPTPLACNSTLTGMITAVRAVRAAVAELDALEVVR